MCIPLWQDLSCCTMICDLATLTLMAYLWKTLILAITLEPEEVERSYFTCAFLVIRPCTLFLYFWPCRLTFLSKILFWAMTFESEVLELNIVAIYIWLPLASYVVFVTTLVVLPLPYGGLQWIFESFSRIKFLLSWTKIQDWLYFLPLDMAITLHFAEFMFYMSDINNATVICLLMKLNNRNILINSILLHRYAHAAFVFCRPREVEENNVSAEIPPSDASWNRHFNCFRQIQTLYTANPWWIS